MAEEASAQIVAAPPAATPGKRERFGHPSGLIVLAGTEFWDRISFHGMQALLVLYMAGQLLLPGHVEHVAGLAGVRRLIESVTGPLSTQALATQIFGLYVGLVYFTPVFGGLLGDRLLGRRRAVALGAALMAAGHFCMAFDRSFLPALLLLILGAGCLRGNLLSQVGDLYSTGDRRRADGFQIYVAVLNSGAFLAPLITGVLAQGYGWHYGFAFAGVGMLVGLVIYLAGYRSVPADTPRGQHVIRAALAAADRRAVLFLCLTLPMLVLFWIAQSQVWNTYNLWARDHLDLVVAGWRMPVPWVQAMDGLCAVVLVAPVVGYWRRQAGRGREPDEFAKITIGCAIFAASMAWLAAGGLVANAAGKVPLVWVLGFYILEGVGYLYVAPIAITLFSRAAPAAVNAMMVGVYYLSVFAGSALSGRLGGLYERLSPDRFWLLHAAIVSAGGLVVLLCAPRLRRELRR
jgi:proton-dependent oligopeptide transporter, POT family